MKLWLLGELSLKNTNLGFVLATFSLTQTVFVCVSFFFFFAFLFLLVVVSHGHAVLCSTLVTCNELNFLLHLIVFEKSVEFLIAIPEIGCKLHMPAKTEIGGVERKAGKIW